jgi:hypothetical protein
MEPAPSNNTIIVNPLQSKTVIVAETPIQSTPVIVPENTLQSKTVFVAETPQSSNKNKNKNKNIKMDTEKEKEKRIITKTNKWKKIDESHFLSENQFSLIEELIQFKKEEKEGNINVLPTSLQTCILQEIRKKIYGYKNQDIIKQLYDESQFVNIDQVMSLLYASQLNCFYCKEKVNILYESVREPKQWSLERIDNTFGHNYNNVEIACLTCNLRRRTMYHERFLFTKQLGIIKKIEG